MEAERAAAMERANQNRALRGMILNILYQTKGRPTMMKIIESAVLEATGKTGASDELIFYLDDKGYVQRKGPDEHKIPGIGEVVLITAKGIDLVEGSLEDPGVTF